jgi:hypothetical protein
MQTKRFNMLTTNETKAIEWIDAQLLKPNERFMLKEGIYINDLHSCLKSQKERIVFGIDPLRRLAFLRVREIKNHLNNEYK